MTVELPSALLREGLVLLGVVGGPLFGAILAVGLVVGVLQAATQVNDPAVGFLPRLVTGVVVAWVAGSWAMERMAKYVVVAFQRMGQL